MRTRRKGTHLKRDGFCAGCKCRILANWPHMRVYCDPCNEWLRKFRSLNAQLIGRFMDRGKPCVDCGAPANCRDHRDYSKPLQMDVVCQSCNMKRGPAKFPRAVVKASRNWYMERRDAHIIRDVEEGVEPKYVAYRYVISTEEVLSIVREHKEKAA